MQEYIVNLSALTKIARKFVVDTYVFILNSSMKKSNRRTKSSALTVISATSVDLFAMLPKKEKPTLAAPLGFWNPQNRNGP